MPQTLSIDAQTLANWDEARDYDAASSYNWLNAELQRTVQVLEAGGVVEVAGCNEAFSSPQAFIAWAVARYPSSSLRH